MMKDLQQKRLKGDKVQNRLIARGKQRDQKIIELGEKIEKEEN